MFGGFFHHLILPLTLYPRILGAEKGPYQLGKASHAERPGLDLSAGGGTLVAHHPQIGEDLEPNLTASVNRNPAMKNQKSKIRDGHQAQKPPAGSEIAMKLKTKN